MRCAFLVYEGTHTDAIVFRFPEPPIGEWQYLGNSRHLGPAVGSDISLNGEGRRVLTWKLEGQGEKGLLLVERRGTDASSPRS